MTNFKSFKWHYGIVAVLTSGLTACYMDGSSAPSGENIYNNRTISTAPAVGTPAPVVNTVVRRASVEPVQQRAPGPQQPAATPQLPALVE